MKYFSIIYNCLLWAMAVSLTSFKSEWLEMRVNIGYILFVLWIVLCAGSLIVDRKRRISYGFAFSAINLVICSAYGLLLYGARRLAVVPASIVREGMHLTSISFSSVNIILVVFLTIGIIMIFAGKFLKSK